MYNKTCLDNAAALLDLLDRSLLDELLAQFGLLGLLSLATNRQHVSLLHRLDPIRQQISLCL